MNGLKISLLPIIITIYIPILTLTARISHNYNDEGSKLSIVNLTLSGTQPSSAAVAALAANFAVPSINQFDLNQENHIQDQQQQPHQIYQRHQHRQHHHQNRYQHNENYQQFTNSFNQNQDNQQDQTTPIDETAMFKCACNVCPGLENYCNISQHGGSQCFKSIVKRVNETNDSYYLDYTYGCLTEREGDLTVRQCNLVLRDNKHPVMINCCKSGDYCNQLLPDPDFSETRWKDLQTIEETEQIISQTQVIDYTLIIAIIVILVLSLIVMSMLYHRCVSHISSMKLKRTSSSSSTCTSKASEIDLDKSIFHFDQIMQGQFNNPSSGSFSAHTYHSSTTADPCRKSEILLNVDNLPVELTSGLGEHMLNQKTIAQAIRAGKKDHVGSGRFGRVFRGSYHDEDVAVKAFRAVDDDSWRREERILTLLNHDNIVRFIASEVVTVSNTTTEMWMFLEFCPYGSLSDFLDNEQLVISPHQAAKLLYSIINGLNYLHEDFAQGSNLYKPSIAHRDIKSKNILMRTPDNCCIADFGHALLKKDETSLDSGKYGNLHVGTVRYMAPEILRYDPSLNYSHFSTFAQADLYQYGLVMWEVCNRISIHDFEPIPRHLMPYDGVVPTNPEVEDMIKLVCYLQYRPPIKEKWLDNPIMSKLTDVLVECWRDNPKARMETLGVKKKLREALYQYSATTTPQHFSSSHLIQNMHQFDDHRKYKFGTITDFTM